MTELVKLENIVNIRAGLPFRSRPEADSNGNVTLVQQKNVNESRTALEFADAMRFTPDRDISSHYLSEGDVLFMGKGHSIFACVANNLPGYTVAAGLFFVLSLKEKMKERVVPEYVAWTLNRGSIRDQLLLASGSGVSMPVVRRKVLEELKICLPSLETQQNIVDLHLLSVKEKNLMRKLAEKRESLVNTVSENSIKVLGGRNET